MLVLAFSASSYATDRLTIEPIGFYGKSQFLYRAKDPACVCQKSNCAFEDEGGKQECIPVKLISFDLSSDKVTFIDQKTLKAISVAGTPPAIGKFPIVFNGDRFSVSLRDGCNKNYESFPPGTSNVECEVFLISKNLGRKKVSSISFYPSPNHSISVIGYFKHPSELKVVIVLQEGNYQFEGESYFYQKTIGADLTKGFKK